MREWLLGFAKVPSAMILYDRRRTKMRPPKWSCGPLWHSEEYAIKYRIYRVYWGISRNGLWWIVPRTIAQKYSFVWMNIRNSWLLRIENCLLHNKTYNLHKNTSLCNKDNKNGKKKQKMNEPRKSFVATTVKKSKVIEVPFLLLHKKIYRDIVTHLSHKR